jgi:TM2 domain-containing membrane protein YozV
MPQCRNCHRQISNYDKDVCPFCGTPNPIATDYKTQDMTQFVDPLTGDYKLYKSKSKKATGFLMLFLGVFGAPYFYVKKTVAGIIVLASSLAIIGGIGSLLFFLVPALHNALGYLIPFLALFVIYALLSIRIFTADSLKDGNGEFLR